jgi:hypothetical protein
MIRYAQSTAMLADSNIAIRAQTAGCNRQPAGHDGSRDERKHERRRRPKDRNQDDLIFVHYTRPGAYVYETRSPF